jgi:hypothetical protein
VGNMALYEAAQDVKLDFRFGKKRRSRKIIKCRYEIFGKKKLKLVFDIQHCNIQDFHTTYVKVKGKAVPLQAWRVPRS